MPIKVKGIIKGGIKCISHIFVYKEEEEEEEQEMNIGHPTDVQHVAHIGWDGTSDHAPPSWMSEFQPSSNLPSSSLVSTEDPSHDSEVTFDQYGSFSQSTDTSIARSGPDIPKAVKKKKRKKARASSSAVSRSGSRQSSRSIDSYATAYEEADEMYIRQF